MKERDALRKKNAGLSVEEKRKKKAEHNAKIMVHQLKDACRLHKQIVKRSMPYFSTKPIFADYYAAFNDNDLIEAPLDDPERVGLLRN